MSRTVRITATTEKTAQTVAGFWSYTNGTQWWHGVRLVAWISQYVSESSGNYTAHTTVYFKWQIDQYNYYPYWNDSHTYSVTFGGQTKTANFNLPQSTTNGSRNMTTAQSITVTHTTVSEGQASYTDNMSVSGYKCWDAFSETVSIVLPSITVPDPDDPDPEPVPVEPDRPDPIVTDNVPYYYIYADGEIVYVAGIEGYEVLNPKLTLEVNKAGSLTFDIPVGSEMYNKLKLMKTTVECRQGNEVLFRGRVLTTKRNIRNTLTYYCEGFLSWLVDIVLEPYTYTGAARDLLKDYLAKYNTRASSNRQITYKYSDISTNIATETKDYSDAWSEVKKVLIDGVGGYIAPYLTSSETGIQWLSTYGAGTSQVVQFGKNLLDFSESIDASNIFTAVRPYGKEIDGTRVSLTEGFVTDEDSITMFGRIERTVIFDEITTESALRAAATQYLRNGLYSAITLNVTAVDLHLLSPTIERIRVGDQIRVVSVPHDVDAYFMCTKAVIDLQDASHTVFTLGSTQRTISELTDTSVNKFVITEGV